MSRRLPYYRVFDDHRDRYRPQHRLARWLGTAFLGLVILLLGAAWQQARASEDVTQSLDETAASSLLFRTGQPGRYTPATRLDSETHISVSGMVAEVTVRQRFHNDSRNWVEGVYVFPLPETAAVHRLRMTIGERVIEGKIQEREQAKRTYEKAKREGRKASLVEQERPNLFTNSVANIGPGETVTVEITYLQSVTYDQGVFSLRFPMTITPRYIPGNPLPANDTETGPLQVNGNGWAVNTDQVPDANRITPVLDPVAASAGHPVNPIRITADLDMGMPLKTVNSAYHSIVLARQGQHYTVKLAGDTVSMDQDFVLSWEPAIGQQPQAAVFTQTVGGEDYALLMIMPPVQAMAAATLPREMIYIIDTSGSMGGVSIEQARESLLLALSDLKPQDRFNVIEFNSVPNALFGHSVDASPQNLARANDFVHRLQATGGTEMLPALDLALRDAPIESHLRQVIFITDGAVGNEDALFRLIHDKLGSGRLFTVGIGSAPNSFFMRKAAQFGRGTFTHIGDVREVQEKMSALLKKLGNPVIANIQVHWPEGTQAEMYPQQVPDLYLGEPVLVSVRAPALNGMVRVDGQAAGQSWHRELPLRSSAQHPGIGTLWAREKISVLLDEKTTGRDEAAVREDVLKVALLHQLVSPYTSFVAEERVVSRPAEAGFKTTAAANARPQGQSPQPYAYPKTATASFQQIAFGLFIGLLAWLSRRVLRTGGNHELA